MRTKTSSALIVLISFAGGVAVWAALRFTAPNLLGLDASSYVSPGSGASTEELWERAVARVKEVRVEDPGARPLEIPAELRHYSERRWFLGTQVAEVRRHSLATYQDFLDLATELKSGKLVGVPAVTESYVLYGVGQIADEKRFTRFAGDRNIELLNDVQLEEELARIEAKRTSLAQEISDLNRRLAALKRRDRARRADLQKQIATRQQEQRSNDEQKQVLQEMYGQPESRERLFRGYESLQSLAKDFRGRSFDLDNAADRQAFKVTLLSSLRLPAFKLMEEIAVAYHRHFNRPLPVSSLVRPEQYQRALRKVNRGAALIDAPPHSTGLAFDIDYRYMSIAEQNFLMVELARLKQAGRIEVLRERTANFHVFVFLDGTRPSDELVTKSLEEVGPAPTEASETKPTRAKSNTKKSRPSRVRSNSRRRR